MEREIEIIGEAANKLLKIDESIQIEHARKIVNTRNWIIHGYDNVDDMIIWGVITNYLPRLKEDIYKLLDKE